MTAKRTAKMKKIGQIKCLIYIWIFEQICLNIISQTVPPFCVMLLPIVLCVYNYAIK